MIEIMAFVTSVYLLMGLIISGGLFTEMSKGKKLTAVGLIVIVFFLPAFFLYCLILLVYEIIVITTKLLSSVKLTEERKK